MNGFWLLHRGKPNTACQPMGRDQENGIGIGAGSDVDGQVLVLHDMLGITEGFTPRFLRKYLNMGEQMRGALEQYVNDVRSVDFPNDKEQY
jgi:3-methyl-2-oxobutanoate hydroxymethyltransferase